MKRKTYKIEDEEQILIFEEEYDSNGNVIYYKDYQSEPIFEKYTKFNSKGYIVGEIEFADSVESDRFSVIYDNHDDAIEQNHFIGGELYEKVLTIKNDNGFERKTFHFGEEVEIMIRINSDSTDYENKFYEEGNLVETQIYKFNVLENVGITKIYDSEGNILATQIEQFDEKERVVEFKEINESDNLLEEVITEYNDDLIVREIHRQFLDSPFEHFITYTYDDNNNQIKKEVKTATGGLIEFFHSKYDSQNKLIAESGYSVGNYNAIYGTSVNHSEFNFLHKYDE